MTAKELLLTEERMRQEDEGAYNEYARLVLRMAVGDAVAFVEKWTREHPEEISNAD